MSDPVYPPPPPPTYDAPGAPPPPGPPPGPPPVYNTADQYGMPHTTQTYQPYGAAQPPGYTTHQTATVQHQTVVINQVGRGYGHGRAMYHMPTMQTCPHCGNNAMTRVDSKLSAQGWIWIIILLVLGCWPWCLLPLCMPGCKDHTHYCSSCNAQVGGRSGGI